ncbi:MAG TPA: IS5 family transposase [Candidatus Nanoarchaeia archaeon]|nr:IS5 family transposase [Candidatus Nanoarchaeia archaeon]
MTQQTSFLSLASFNRKTLRCERFLNEMDQVIPWDNLVKLIKPHYSEAEAGRKKKDLVLMLKIYFLQQWYNLSDPEMEDAIYDRNSFQKFLRLDMMSNTAPDETTILNFRHLLEKHALPEKMFGRVNRILEDKGLILKKGTITDATIIAAPSSTKNLSGKRDPEMSSTKKGNDWHFGLKAHTGADSQSGLVHTLKVTTASIHDSQLFDDLLHGEEREVYGDKAYHDTVKARQFRKNGTKWRVTIKAVRGKPLTINQEEINKKRSIVRSKVERPFLVIKHLWGYTKTRYRGLYKNGMKLYTSFMLANLFLARKQLLKLA